MATECSSARADKGERDCASSCVHAESPLAPRPHGAVCGVSCLRSVTVGGRLSPQAVLARRKGGRGIGSRGCAVVPLRGSCVVWFGPGAVGERDGLSVTGAEVVDGVRVGRAEEPGPQGEAVSRSPEPSTAPLLRPPPFRWFCRLPPVSVPSLPRSLPAGVSPRPETSVPEVLDRLRPAGARSEGRAA